MRKYGKWVLTLGLLAATPGLTLAAGSKSKADEKPAAESTSAKAANQKVANDIAKAMKAARIQGREIDIRFNDGVASLSGVVADAKVRDRAHEAVSRVPGVTRVENRLTVPAPAVAASTARPGAESGGGVVSANHTASPAKSNRVQQVNGEMQAPSSNQAMAEQIGSALTAANLDGFDIGIRYHSGVALLEGSVGTQAERAAAEQAAYSVPGIRSVANRLVCTQERAMAAAPRQQMPQGQPGQYAPVGYRQGEAPMPGAMPMAPGMAPGMPPAYGHPGAGASQAVYNNPSVPDYAWPTYAQYPNSAAVSYPQQYSASAWPYIGPFYPYPQVPMGWRDATLRWDDGQWNLMFRTRTDKWWWYFNPNNW
ncbi:MAG: BON domain-containing protein [Planctomycetes bacterium]|nr:BON domain-containing protein [Planctomycetota bacterium]